MTNNFPLWNDHFPSLDQIHLFQGDSQKVNFLKIWVNLEDVILKNHFPHVKKDGLYDHLKSQPLTEADLDIPYNDYKGKTGTIRSRYL